MVACKRLILALADTCVLIGWVTLLFRCLNFILIIPPSYTWLPSQSLKVKVLESTVSTTNFAGALRLPPSLTWLTLRLKIFFSKTSFYAITAFESVFQFARLNRYIYGFDNTYPSSIFHSICFVTDTF